MYSVLGDMLLGTPPPPPQPPPPPPKCAIEFYYKEADMQVRATLYLGCMHYYTCVCYTSVCDSLL